MQKHFLRLKPPLPAPQLRGEIPVLWIFGIFSGINIVHFLRVSKQLTTKTSWTNGTVFSSTSLVMRKRFGHMGLRGKKEGDFPVSFRKEKKGLVGLDFPALLFLFRFRTSKEKRRAACARAGGLTGGAEARGGGAGQAARLEQHEGTPHACQTEVIRVGPHKTDWGLSYVKILICVVYHSSTALLSATTFCVPKSKLLLARLCL